MINDTQIWAEILGKYGRNGDTMLAHITPSEAEHLKRRGGSGTRNPHTGLLEFWGGDNDGGMSGGEGSDSVGNGGMSGDSKGGDTMGGGEAGSNDRGGFLGGGVGPGGFFSAGEDLGKESEISERSGGVNWNDYDIANYSKPGTFGRLGQELVDPSVKASRWGAPTAQAMGFLGPAMGVLAGPAFGALMGLGAAMGRAQSPAEQAASMAEQAATGSKNSTGQDNTYSRASNPNAWGADAGLNLQPVSTPEPTKVQDMAPARMTPESWDEDGFLNRNPEVKAAVSSGTWNSGYDFNRAYQQHAGVPYEAAMTYSQPDKYVEDLLTTRRNEVMPYKGY